MKHPVYSCCLFLFLSVRWHDAFSLFNTKCMGTWFFVVDSWPQPKPKPQPQPKGGVLTSVMLQLCCIVWQIMLPVNVSKKMLPPPLPPIMSTKFLFLSLKNGEALFFFVFQKWLLRRKYFRLGTHLEHIFCGRQFFQTFLTL